MKVETTLKIWYLRSSIFALWLLKGPLSTCELYDRLFETTIQSHGKNRLDIARVGFARAQAYHMSGKNDFILAAQDMYLNALELVNQVYGAEHNSILAAKIHMGIATWYLERHQTAKARPHAEQALTMIDALETSGSLELAEALHLLSQILQAQGEHERADKLHKRATLIWDNYVEAARIIMHGRHIRG